MTMRRVAIIVSLFGLAVVGPARAQLQNEDRSGGACLSSAESRDLFVADKLVPPFRVMRETARTVQAEAIDIQLCRAQGMLVYDVTLLDPQGRVSHRLINATTGVPLPAPVVSPGSMPRPAFQGPRPAPGFYPGPGPDGYFVPRFRPNMLQGQRPGPYGYQGPRPGAPFFPGMRPLDRGP